MENRNSAFELMRLLAMLMIIFGHCMLATAQNVDPYLVGLDNIGWGVKAFTVCGVNLFFLLTGYFLKSSRPRFGRIIDIWIKTIFYSVTIYLILSLYSSSFSGRDLVGFVLPVFTSKYWFIQTYIVLALLVPYFSIGLEKLNESQFNFLIGVLLIFFCIHETFFKVMYTLDMTQGYGIIWGSFMCCMGYWLRRHESFVHDISYWRFFLGYVILSILIFMSNYLIVACNIAGGVSSRGNFYAYNSVTVFLQSVCLFCIFIKYSTKIRYHSLINNMSKNVLAGYLISSHPVLLKPLWTDFFEMTQFDDNILSYLFVAIVLSSVTLVMCINIDKLVDKFFEHCCLKQLYKKLDDVFGRVVIWNGNKNTSRKI